MRPQVVERRSRRPKTVSHVPPGSGVSTMKCQRRPGNVHPSRAHPIALPATAAPIEEISMNTTSESHTNSPGDAPAAAGPARKVLVWDAPVRVFHWLMVFSFAGAYLTAESERWRLLHVSLGYTMAGLVAFRIVW